jgi:hypothetical protein
VTSTFALSDGTTAHEWICTLSTNGNVNGGATRGSGESAREAIMRALEQAGVELP